jgi:hypothetical protein
MKVKQSSKPIITQDKLGDYCRLIEEERQVRARLKRLRYELLNTFDAGVTVEDGPLVISVKSISTRRFSFSALSELLGALATKKLHDQIRPTVGKRLRVSLRVDGQVTTGLRPVEGDDEATQ